MRSRSTPPTHVLTCEVMATSREDSLSLFLQLKATRMEFSCEEEEGHGEDKDLLSVLGEN